MGIGFLILVMLAGKLPALIEVMFDRNRNPRPAPVQREEQQRLRALEHALDRAKQEDRELPAERGVERGGAAPAEADPDAQLDRFRELEEEEHTLLPRPPQSPAER